MPKLYSFDFKKSVINSYLNLHYSVHSVLQIFHISKSTLFNWVNLYRNNLFSPVQNIRSFYNSKFSAIKSFVQTYVLKRKNFKMFLLKRYIFSHFKCNVSSSSIYSILKQFKITHKKFSKHINKNNSKSKLTDFFKQIKSIDSSKIISIDESSFDVFISPSYGWQRKGQKLYKYFKYSQRKRITLTLAVTNKRIIGFNIIDGSSNLSNFISFLSSFLPFYKNYTLLMDNVNFHHSKSVTNYVNNSKNSILYNVPYNPETNPIEFVFKIIKDFVKTNMLSVKTNIKNLILKSFKFVTSDKLNNIFNRSLNL